MLRQTGILLRIDGILRAEYSYQLKGTVMTKLRAFLKCLECFHRDREIEYVQYFQDIGVIRFHDAPPVLAS